MRAHMPGRKITRGLRFRLTISYAIFFTILLALIGFLFRQTLIESLDSQLREVLEQEWAAVKVATFAVRDALVTVAAALGVAA